MSVERAWLIDSLSDLGEVLSGQGYDVRPLVFEEPATEAEVAALEASLGASLPVAFRTALLEISRHVEFRWFAPEKLEYPRPFRENFCGDLHWSLDFTSQFSKDVQSWRDEVFPNLDDPYDRVWHDKLGFFEVGNGDFWSFDMTDGEGRIVYLSHDDGEGHGHVLANDFDDLLLRCVPVACAGGEDWQWIPFTNSLQTMIDPNGAVGQQWREVLGLH